MRVYQMKTDQLAAQLNSHPENGCCADVTGTKDGVLKRIFFSINGMINLHRSKLYYVNLITALCYGLALLFSFLNRSAPLLRYTFGMLCVTAILYLAEGFFLYQYKETFYKRLTQKGHRVNVIRGGEKKRVMPDELVIGDLLVLEEGTILYADARIISCEELMADEQLVFDSTISVEKNEEPILRENLAPEKQKNMLWKGSYITAGHGLAFVTALGADCYVDKTGGRKGKKQRSFFYNKQNNIGHIASYIFIILVAIGLLLSIVFTHRYIEAFLIMAAITSLMMLNPVSCLMEWTYYRTALKLYGQGALIRNIEAFDSMNKEKKLYFDAGDLLQDGLTYSNTIDFHGSEKSNLSYFSLCVGEGHLFDAVQERLVHYGLSNEQLIQNYPVFRRDQDEAGNLFSVFSNNGTSVTVAVGYWQKMLPLLQEVDEAVIKQIREMEIHGKMVYLMANDSTDFIPTKLDLKYFFGRMKITALVIYGISVIPETLSMMAQMRHASMETLLISDYSEELNQALAGMYDVDGVLSAPPETPCFTLPHLKEQNLAVFTDASPIERERAMLVLSRDVPPHKIIYAAKCMFCGIRRCLNFLAIVGLFFVLTVISLVLSNIPIEKVIFSAVLLKIVLLCPCYYLIESVRNCNQHNRSLILGFFCGIVGFVASLIYYELALFALELSCLFLAIYLMISSMKHRKVGKKEVMLLIVAAIAALLPWIFIPGNWAIALLLACFPPLGALLLDLFY